MDSEASSISGRVLTKEELGKVLSELPTGYIKPKSLMSNPPICTPFKKLGVLVDLEELTEGKQVPASIERNSHNANTTSQSYICAECKRTLPTAHLLDLHITEQHDTYFSASVERGDKPMYACYLAECAIKLHSAKERKDHCITVHKFPPNYRFDQSKAKVSSDNLKNEASMDVDEAVAPTKKIQLPYIKAFSFGHHTQRTFNTRRERSEPGKTLVDVQAMKDALNDIVD